MRALLSDTVVGRQSLVPDVMCSGQIISGSAFLACFITSDSRAASASLAAVRALRRDTVVGRQSCVSAVITAGQVVSGSACFEANSCAASACLNVERAFLRDTVCGLQSLVSGVSSSGQTWLGSMRTVPCELSSASSCVLSATVSGRQSRVSAVTRSGQSVSRSSRLSSSFWAREASSCCLRVTVSGRQSLVPAVITSGQAVSPTSQLLAPLLNRSQSMSHESSGGSVLASPLHTRVHQPSFFGPMRGLGSIPSEAAVVASLHIRALQLLFGPRAELERSACVSPCGGTPKTIAAIAKTASEMGWWLYFGAERT
mmetsp:Transcript_102449/g.306015  ORF Transcript_102449/g.306015 Transcript_102449/m.306015 type:complete len:314 (+) Transcript_102449:1020-1961(+)